MKSIDHLTMLVLLLLIQTLYSTTAACPVWTVRDKTSSQCICGDSLLGLVSCHLDPYRISIQRCSCLTYNEEIRKVTVGRCLIACLRQTRGECRSSYSIQSQSPEDLNYEVCGALNRTGQLCGDCITGYGPPVLTYTLQCVECSIENFAQDLFKYIFFAFLPLTVVYAIVIVWKVSITSHKMVAYVFTSQLITAPYILKLTTKNITKNGLFTLALDYVSFWNMDIFRTTLPPFCIHPSLNTMQVIALDYLVAIYPILLILLTYLAVVLHNRHPLLAAAWRPATKVLMCIRKEWNIRGSLVQAFTTFLVLSYVKILNTSMELLNPVHLHESLYINTLYYLYSAGTVPYFGKEHLPYGILAITMLILFIFLPTLFLVLYPISSFRRCLGVNNSIFTHTFMDAFTSCYRTKYIDMRGFVAIYFVARILNLLTFAMNKDESILMITGFYLIALAIAVILVKPYNNRTQNQLDCILLLNAACIFLLIPAHEYFLAYNHRENKRHHLSQATIAAVVLCFTVHVLYGIIVLLGKICPKNVLKWFQKGPSQRNEEAPLIA